MSSLYPVIGVMIVIVLSPGPNNILVMNAGMRGGAKAAAPLIAGVLSGSVLLFALVNLGLGASIEQLPLIENIAAAAAVVYLLWLGLSLQRSAPGPSAMNEGSPVSATGVIVLQFLNPKAWALMSFVVASTHRTTDLWLVLTAICVVTVVCLTLWAGAGALLSRHLQDRRVFVRINRIMGASLIVFAGLIIVHQMRLL
ncbi:LysE family translocator [bacterium AH-315-P15]|nr:LysE family translocator [bacterium AH-315-P15]